MNPRRIFLVGLSGAGKSTVGPLLAETLGWQFADADRDLEQHAGRSIPDIFREDGEPAFRELEAAALKRLAETDGIVIATGGGAPTYAPSRETIASGFVVWLDVTPQHAARRLRANPDTENRPLLEGDLEARLESLYEARHHLYEDSDTSVAVDYYAPEQVVDRIRIALDAASAAGWTPDPRRFTPVANADGVLTGTAAVVTTPTASYPVIVREGVLDDLGAICRTLGLKGRGFLLSDDRVGPLVMPRATASMEAAEYDGGYLAIPSGEEHKNLETLAGVYEWLLAHRVERSDFVVCLGGGVVTDLGGFAAATCLRGIDFVHVPTTLLGMVDASVGGKTGVDHPRGKNMIGAFAQPRAVVMDPGLLATLPERQLRAGWAEVIKHAFILDPVLLQDLEAVAGDPAAMRNAGLIGRSAAIKAAVVSEDERESARRTLLNYGHTIGHAIESVTGYSSYLHGEAVAIGMRAAGLISVALGLLPQEQFERQQRLIRLCGLPESAPGLDLDAVLQAASGDKKVVGGKVRWVLLEGLGNAIVRADVPPEIVREAVRAVLT